MTLGLCGTYGALTWPPSLLPGLRRRGPGVGVDETQDLRVRMHVAAGEALREPLPLLAFVVLQHRVHESLERRRPAPNDLGAEPGVRAILHQLLSTQRVEPAQHGRRELPQPHVDQTT